MSFSLIKFYAFNANGNLKSSQWIVKEDYRVLYDLKETGFERLKIAYDDKKVFNFYELQKNGEKIELAGGEDVTVIGTNYLIIEKTAENILGKFFFSFFTQNLKFVIF